MFCNGTHIKRGFLSILLLIQKTLEVGKIFKTKKAISKALSDVSKVELPFLIVLDSRYLWLFINL